MKKYLISPPNESLDDKPRHEFVWRLLDTIFAQILYAKHKQIIKFTFVIVLSIVGLLIRFAIAPINGGLPFLTFFPIIALCAILLGIWPGLLATALCSVLAAYFFFPPYLSFAFFMQSNQLMPISIFFIDGALITASIGVVQHYFWIKIKEELDAKKDQFRQVVDMAPNALIMTNKNGVIEIVNARAEAIFGYKRDEIVGQEIEVLIPKNLHDQHAKHRTGYVANPSHRAMGIGRDLQAKHKDGHEIPVEIALNPINTRRGLKVLAAIVDISERKRMEQELIKTNERFSIASSTAGLGFWEYDVQTHNLRWDKWMFHLYGLEPQADEQPLTLWSARVHPEDLESTERMLNEAISGLHPFATTFRIYLPNGQLRHLKASAFVVRDTDGRALTVIGVNIDITDSSQAEARQQALISELKKINAELTNFSYVASHDLKSPLRGIHQLSNWISEDLAATMDDATKENLRLMRNRIQRMERLLDDLLTYSRVGRTEDEIVFIQLREMIREIFEFTVDTKPFMLNLNGDIPHIYSRKTPLELIFRNLIGNAIKHHHQARGVIDISAHMQGTLIEFTVKDDGPGIPPEQNERAFAIFQTLKPRDVVEGSGIGLALIKKTVEAAGGTIALDSDGQSGCTFRFTWPASIEKPAALIANDGDISP